LTQNNTGTEVVSKCVLFGAFSYMIQFVLAVLSFMVLVLKRTRENPRRPWKIWSFDVSKQILSACTIHMLNLIIAIFLSVDTKTDQCVWYFLNLFVDTTLGVFICFAFLLLVDRIAREKNIKDLQSGLYFERIKREDGKTIITVIKPKMYFIQLGVWILIVIISKGILLGFSTLMSKYLESMGNFILKPFKGDEKLELVVVMVMFPLIFNTIQFWVLDNVLKLPEDETKEVIEASPEFAVPASSVEMKIKSDYVPPTEVGPAGINSIAGLQFDKSESKDKHIEICDESVNTSYTIDVK